MGSANGLFLPGGLLQDLAEPDIGPMLVIVADEADAYLAKRRQDKKDKRGASARTANGYLQAIKQLCHWMVSEDRAPSSPVAHLRRYNEKADRRRIRRVLTEDECRQLLADAEAGPVRYGLPGADRAML